MSKYFSKIHRGFLVQQTEGGWIVPQLPNWSNGPVPQGPFGTFGIACHVIDRVLDADERRSQQLNHNSADTSPSFGTADFSALGQQLSLVTILIGLFVYYPLKYSFFISGLAVIYFTLLHKYPNAILALIISVVCFKLADKTEKYINQRDE